MTMLAGNLTERKRKSLDNDAVAVSILYFAQHTLSEAKRYLADAGFRKRLS